MKLRYTRPALADLDAVLEGINRESPGGAARVAARLKAVIALTRQYPSIGVRTEDPAIRRVVATPYPYVVFYEARADEIIVHAVRHAARKPSSMPGSDEAL